jgi:hypothetical protein
MDGPVDPVLVGCVLGVIIGGLLGYAWGWANGVLRIRTEASQRGYGRFSSHYVPAMFDQPATYVDRFEWACDVVDEATLAEPVETNEPAVRLHVAD